MTDWDVDDLVLQFQNEAGIPTVSGSEISPSTDIVPRLSRAQNAVIAMIGARFPEALYQAPIALTPSSDHKTFSYGTDSAGNAVVPLGYVQVSPSLSSFSGERYFVGWVEGREFLDEGAQIRIPSNRSYTGTLYARFVPTAPAMVSGGQQPILNPAAARILIVRKAVKDYALEGAVNVPLGQLKDAQFKEDFRSWMTTYRTRFKGGGGLIDPARWWFGTSDLGTNGM
jgi:hypothetical protein